MTIPNASDLVSSAILGLWAFGGAVLRTGMDWNDPVTKKFSFARFGTAGVTALVLGQGAAAIGGALHWEPALIGAAASVLGWLGPATAMAILGKRFGLGASDVESSHDAK